MKCASFNVLADAYTGYGDYSHITPSLLLPGARTPGLLRIIDSLKADVIGLQEVEKPLLDALDDAGTWQTFWSPKGRNKPDGCLMLVRTGIEVRDHTTHAYGDGSGHVMQAVRIGETIFANTHIKWAPTTDRDHAGVKQTVELLNLLGNEQPAVLFADCNDKPGGPVRQLIERAGFKYVHEEAPTALVDQEPVALDLVAVRGLSATLIPNNYPIRNIPNGDCPSDHMPVVAHVSIK